MAIIAVPKTGELLQALRPGSRAMVRVTGHSDDGGLAVVDAAALNRPRTVPLSALRPREALCRRRPPRSGYAPLTEADFVHRLLNDACRRALGDDDPDAVVPDVVVFVRAHPDWTSGGIARLAHDYGQVGGVCVRVLARAGYGAEPTPAAGFGSALRFRRRDRHHLCPALEKPPRGSESWEPWACDLERGHTEPHHNTEMSYHWADDTGPVLCGAWASRGPGQGLGSCTLPAGHPPTQDHRDTVGEYLTGRTPQ